MDYEVQDIKMEEEFKVCPSCGYKDGFHSMFRKEGDITKWLFICPSCHEVFDIGFTVQVGTADIPSKHLKGVDNEPGFATDMDIVSDQRRFSPSVRLIHIRVYPGAGAKATQIVKGWAKHLGADLVGICKIDHRWAYSHKGEVHYGEWEEWAIPSEMTLFTLNAQRSSGQA